MRQSEITLYLLLLLNLIQNDFEIITISFLYSGNKDLEKI